MTLPPHKEKELAALIREIATSPMNAAFANVKKIVAAWGIEPRKGFVVNELSVTLGGGVVVSVEGRARKGTGVSIVRVNGENVLHQFGSLYVPGEWERELERAVAAINAEAKARAHREAAADVADGTLIVSKAA